jgi:hypothetical protein
MTSLKFDILERHNLKTDTKISMFRRNILPMFLTVEEIGLQESTASILRLEDSSFIQQREATPTCQILAHIRVLTHRSPYAVCSYRLFHSFISCHAYPYAMQYQAPCRNVA